MRKINIKDVELNIDMTPFLEMKNVKNKINVDIDGNVYINEEVPKNKAIIYVNEDYEKKEDINDIKSLSNDKTPATINPTNPPPKEYANKAIYPQSLINASIN